MKVGFMHFSSMNSPTSLSSMREFVRGGVQSTIILSRIPDRNSLVSLVWSSGPGGNFSPQASSGVGIISIPFHGLCQFGCVR